MTIHLLCSLQRDGRRGRPTNTNREQIKKCAMTEKYRRPTVQTETGRCFSQFTSQLERG